MENSKQIVIRKDTDELIEKLRVGDESYNSVIWRNLSKLDGGVDDGSDGKTGLDTIPK